MVEGKATAMRTIAEDVSILWLICAVALVVSIPCLAASFEAKRPPEPVGVVISQRTTLQQIWDAGETPVATLDGTIAQFDVENEDIPSAVARLSNDYHFVCGIIPTPWPPTSRLQTGVPAFARVSASFRGATVRQILDALTSSDPTFEWWEDGGVVNVAPVGTLEASGYPLNKNILHWEADGVPYMIALYGAPSWSGVPLLSMVPNTLPLTFGYSGPPLEEYPLITTSASDESILQLLNDMAQQLRLSWLLFDLRPFGYQWAVFLMGVDLPTMSQFFGNDETLQTEATASPCPCPEQPPAAIGSTRTAVEVPNTMSQREATSVLVPVRKVLSAHGFAVAWDAAADRATAAKGNTVLVVTAGSSVACLNGTAMILGAPAILRKGRLLVPEMAIDLALRGEGKPIAKAR